MSDAQPTNGKRRDKIWELDPIWHCVIVGTCLTLGELRALARKLGYRLEAKRGSDYEIHSHFVYEAGRPKRGGKMLNKLLNRKHTAAIRRFAQADTPEELETLWQNTFSAGEIPGPLWAAASHPALTHELATQVYGDVHMLSHLVGAANRADIRMLHRLEQESADLMEKLTCERRRNRKRAEQDRRSIAQLSEKLLRAERAEERAALLEAELAAFKDSQSSPRQACGPESQATAALREKLAEQSAALQDMSSALGDAKMREAALRAECDALEELLNADPTVSANGSRQSNCPFDLDGRCILYVGGRTTIVCRLRALVQQWNGEFLHHDGGLEKSIDELASAVSRADAVVFPTDCVSHSAVNKLKLLCRRSMKPFVPLRSAGLSSFVAGLQSSIDSLERPPAGP